MAVEALSSKACCSNQSRQFAYKPAIMDHGGNRGDGTLLKRIVVTYGKGRGSIVAIEDRQLSAGANDTVCLCQCLLCARDMAQTGVEDQDIKRRIIKGEGSGIERRFDTTL